MGKLLKVFNDGVGTNVFNTHRGGKTVSYIVIGVVMVMSLIFLGGCQPSCEKVIGVYQSKYGDVNQTCDALQTSLKANGFNVKGVLNLNKSMESHGVQLHRKTRVVQFGQPEYACSIVKSNPEASVLMPCAFGVYEDSGGVYVSSLDRSLFGRVFGGVTEMIMAGSISRDLSNVLYDCTEYRSLDIKDEPKDSPETNDILWINE